MMQGTARSPAGPWERPLLNDFSFVGVGTWVGGWREMSSSQRLGRESHAPSTPDQDPHGVDCGPVTLLPGPGVHGAVAVRGLDRGGAGPLTLAAVTCPKQGLLVLTVI